VLDQNSKAYRGWKHAHEIPELRLPVLSNFIFFGVGLLQLEFPGKVSAAPPLVAILVLVYAAMRAASALRSFYFFQRIERLEGEARRLAGAAGDGPAAAAARKQIVSEVAGLRQAGEMKSYIDLLFLALIVLLCVFEDRDGLACFRTKHAPGLDQWHALGLDPWVVRFA